MFPVSPLKRSMASVRGEHTNPRHSHIESIPEPPETGPVVYQRARNSTAFRMPAIHPGVRYDVYFRTCGIHPVSCNYLPRPACRRSNPSDSTPHHKTRGYRRPSNVPILASLSANGLGSAPARSSAAAGAGMRAASILKYFPTITRRFPGGVQRIRYPTNPSCNPLIIRFRFSGAATATPENKRLPFMPQSFQMRSLDINPIPPALDLSTRDLIGHAPLWDSN